MEHAALNALFARAEIFNKFEELGSQLNPEEAEIASHYLENLIKTRPVRAQLCPESEQFEPGLHNLNFREPGLHAPELTDTNCEYCAAGSPRFSWLGEDGKTRFFHEFDTETRIENRNCEAPHA